MALSRRMLAPVYAPPTSTVNPCVRDVGNCDGPEEVWHRSQRGLDARDVLRYERQTGLRRSRFALCVSAMNAALTLKNRKRPFGIAFSLRWWAPLLVRTYCAPPQVKGILAEAA